MSRDPAEVLLRAVDALPREDRDLVLTWLLGRVGSPLGAPLASPALAEALMSQRPSATPRAAALEAVLAEVPGARGEQQVVPVRLPVDQHARLRDWCTEHGFSMAGVIRGLVGQFLDTRAAASRS